MKPVTRNRMKAAPMVKPSMHMTPRLGARADGFRDSLVRKYFVLPKAHEAGDEGITITTGSVDMMGDRVMPEGADLGHYVANPIVLWLHDAYGSTASAGVPIGTSKSLEIIPGRGIRATGIDWLEGDPFAARIKNAWDQGKIRAASIGFMPEEWQPNDFGGFDFTRWRLLEWSLVPVPANPDAVRDLPLAVKAFGIDLEPELLGTGASQHLGEIRAGTPDPIRWNRQLSKDFDVARERYEAASVEYDLASRYLQCEVKELREGGTFVPSARMGSFLSALDESLAAWTVDDIRNLTGQGLEAPPVHQVIQLNSKLRADFLVCGIRFMRSPDARMVLKVAANWYGLEVTTYSGPGRDEGAIAFIDRTWRRAYELNYLKGEAFALSGEFLGRTDEAWEDLFLEPKNEGALRRAVELVNTQGARLANRGLLLMGPPGTGKTLSGRVIRNESESTFIWVSARDFYRAGAFGGLTYAFDLARECAPTVLFIEDVDNWLTPYSVDLLKTEMDGIGRNSGVVTILTTNYPESLPDALIDRPGRFHDVLQFGLPGPLARDAMLARWLPELSPGQREPVVQATAGYSGAHVRELANFVGIIREQEGIELDSAVERAIEKLREQRELIDAIQSADSHYRPRKDMLRLISRHLWDRSSHRFWHRLWLNNGRQLETLAMPKPRDAGCGCPEVPKEVRRISATALLAILRQGGTEAQTVILSKEQFETEAEANEWIRDHDFEIKEGAPDETETSWRYRQFPPGDCQEGGLGNGETFATIELDEGVQAVVCIPKESEEEAGTDTTTETGIVAATKIGARAVSFNRLMVKEGRVLSTRNLNKLKQAAELLQEVVAQQEEAAHEEELSPEDAGKMNEVLEAMRKARIHPAATASTIEAALEAVRKIHR